MSRITVIVMSSDNSSRAVPGFFHQWQKYAADFAAEFFIVCQRIIPQSLPERWAAYRVPDDTDCQNWAGHLRDILFVHVPNANRVLLLMDDYWLCQPIDREGIGAASRMFADKLELDKVDLSGDRLGFAHKKYNKDYVMSHPKAEYLTSTQAALWRPSFLQHCLFNDGWSPWQFELEGTKRISGSHLILGQKNPSIQYANVSLRGQKELRLDRLKQADIDELRAIGAI